MANSRSVGAARCPDLLACSPVACRCWKRSIPATFDFGADVADTVPLFAQAAGAQARLYRGRSRLAVRPGDSGGRGIADQDGRRPEGRRSPSPRAPAVISCCSPRSPRPASASRIFRRPISRRPTDARPSSAATSMHGWRGFVPSPARSAIQCAGALRWKQRPCELKRYLFVVSGIRRGAATC